MSVTQYQLTWDSYKSNVCKGFTNLQQQEEFVDMTLAADGHLVKVHKSIFALASPYIKMMLQSTPNTHPIVFLGNVGHEVLNYILTYVYTGEVSVEADKMKSFIKVAKDLRLSGLFDIPTPKDGSKKYMECDLEDQRDDTNGLLDTENAAVESINDNEVLLVNDSASQPTLENIEVLNTAVTAKEITNMKNFNDMHDVETKKETFNNRNSGLYMTADGYQYKLEINQRCNKPPDSTPIIVEDASDKTTKFIVASNITNTADNSSKYGNDHYSSFGSEFKNKISTASLDLDSLQHKAITLQYTTSTRGALQLILNRFMYYCHHQSHGGRKRRWRCIEYRSKQCPAFIDTDGEIMTSRKFGHNHSFHDEKIRKKIKRDLIFTNLNVLLEKQNEKKNAT